MKILLVNYGWKIIYTTFIIRYNIVLLKSTMDHKQQYILKILQIYFPNDTIIDQSKFPEGLNSEVYKIVLQSNRIVVAKIFNKRIQKNVEKDIQIMKFVNQNAFNTSRIIAYDISDPELGVVLQDFLNGQTGSDFFQDNHLLRSKLMRNFGKNLLRIHSLKNIPNVWQNFKTPIKTPNEWKEWILTRIDKYLLFFNDKLSQKQPEKVAIQLNFLKAYINEVDMQISPLHGDYRLGNVLVDKNAKLLSTLDFENAMPGDRLADLGQAVYWQIFKFGNDTELIDSMLNGYFENYDYKTKQVIFTYALLHLLAVTRTNWNNQELDWLKKKHFEMLDIFI